MFLKRRIQPRCSEVTASPVLSLHLHILSSASSLNPCLVAFPYIHFPLPIFFCFIPFVLISAFCSSHFSNLLPYCPFAPFLVHENLFSLSPYLWGSPWFGKPCCTFFSDTLWLVHLSPVRETVGRRKNPPSSTCSGRGKVSFLSQAGVRAWCPRDDGRRWEGVLPQQQHSGKGPLSQCSW